MTIDGAFVGCNGMLGGGEESDYGGVPLDEPELENLAFVCL